MNHALKLEHVSVAFRQPVAKAPYFAVRDVSLTIERGHFVALIGANGSGKSTLGHVIAGILPVSAGHVDVGGRLAMVFQNPDAQIIGETVYEDLCFGLENRAIPRDEMPTRVRAALTEVGLDVAFEAPIRTLSGGQRQLLCIASALVMEPDILLFDEATAMLNGSARERVLAAAKSLQRRGTTVLWLTQWLEELAVADRVLAMKDGELIFDGFPETFFYGEARPPRFEQTPCHALGWDPPFSVRTAYAMQSQGHELTKLPLTLTDVAQLVVSG